MEATGVLLIGGLSRRFGSVKALAPLRDETLAERAWRLLGEAFVERLAVGKEADQLGFAFPVLDDGVTVRAPLAGVVAGLRSAPTDVAVFLPVDCPLVTAEALRALAEACADAAVTATGPLPGAYARSALPVLEERLAAGRLELHEALTELDATMVELDPDLLASVNTERDLERVRARVT
ncbi:MAG: molybdenum cofactor guanylyltransferase [Actinobacteria bacterium]|nr:MAG: molybdenum cofactor guanylyltransferase [Actinomycetota bacterium]